MRSVHSQPIIGGKDEQDAGVWAGEGYVAYAPGVVLVGLCWGDTIVEAALPAACAACMVLGAVAGVVPGAVVAEVCPLSQRRALRRLPGMSRLCPYQRLC